MHAFLITGASEEKRAATITEKLQNWKVHITDVITLVKTGASIGVADIRGFQQRLHLKPLASDHSVGVITGAQFLTIEAQNALLKTLEEPPPHLFIILEAPTSQALLPTILSRVTHETLGETANDEEGILEAKKQIIMLMAAPPAARLVHVDAVTQTRDDAKRWTQNALSAARSLLKTAGSGKENDTPSTDALARLARNLLEAYAQLDANVNPKLALDCALLDS